MNIYEILFLVFVGLVFVLLVGLVRKVWQSPTDKK